MQTWEFCDHENAVRIVNVTTRTTKKEKGDCEKTTATVTSVVVWSLSLYLQTQFTPTEHPLLLLLYFLWGLHLHPLSVVI